MIGKGLVHKNVKHRAGIRHHQRALVGRLKLKALRKHCRQTTPDLKTWSLEIEHDACQTLDNVHRQYPIRAECRPNERAAWPSE